MGFCPSWKKHRGESTLYIYTWAAHLFTGVYGSRERLQPTMCDKLTEYTDKYMSKQSPAFQPPSHS